ncbi:cupin domain-containing protein [Chloroflexota bacterium]
MEKRAVERMGQTIHVYDEWMEKEGIPIYRESYNIEDMTELPRGPWARLGGKGTFIEMAGAKAAGKQLYVAEIPAGGALEPEKHMYDEMLYIVRGRGLAEVWYEGQGKVSFEWGEGSLFGIPLNAWHRLVNGGREPVLVFGQSAAPIVMNTFRNTEFVFNCDYNFTDRFTGQADYFVAGKKPTEGERGGWETNFVPDVRTVLSGKGGGTVGFNMASWNGSHVSAWPAGNYTRQAHYHRPGATIVGVKGEGYGLLWHRKYGIHPFQDGYGDKVVKAPWKPGTIYIPLSEWFHQHFYTQGPEPGIQLKVMGRGTLAISPLTEEQLGNEDTGNISVREGGTMIKYEDEDPEVRRMFEEELRKNGVECTMEPVVYRTDSFRFSD